MKIFTMAGIVAAALVLAPLSPIGAANAAALGATGTVTFDGAPVPGMEVGWYDPSTDASGETVTDAAGNYSLTVADGHSYVLYAGINHQADPPADAEPWLSIGGPTFTGVFVGANGADLKFQGRTAFTAAVTGQELKLGHPGTVTATDPSLAGTRIALSRTDGALVAAKKADKGGNVTFTGVIPGSYTLVQSSSTGTFAPWTSPALTVTPSTVTTVVPALKQYGSLTGVVTHKGKPVKGIKVTSYTGSKYGDGDVTDSKGRYTLKNAEGDYRVVIEEGSDDGSLINRPVFQTVRTATVAAGQKTVLNIKVQKGGSVSGSVTALKKGFFQARVIDKTGALVGGGYFEVKTTKKSTPFTIRAIETGKATVYITGQSGTRYGSKAVTVKAGTKNAVGTIGMAKKTITVKGTVTGATTGSVRAESIAYGLNYKSGKITGGKYRVSGIIPAAGTSLVVESSTTNAPMATPITSKTSATKNLTAGPLLATLTGRFTAGGFPVLKTGGNIVAPDPTAPQLGSYDVVNGLVTSTGVRPGAGSLVLFGFGDVSPFVSGSPFWFSIPDGKSSATFAPGATTDLGTIELNINGR